MVLTNTEQPPAAAVTLGVVLNEWDVLTPVVVLTAISSFSLVQQRIKPGLIDLL